MNCKYCDSDNVIKFGTYKDTQHYYCKDCKRKFSNPNAIPKMQYDTKTISDCLNMYYEGMSLTEIRRNLIQQDNLYPSRITPYNWVERFTELAVKEAEKHQPKVGDVWIADETYIRIDKQTGKGIDNPYSKSRSAKWVVFWDIIDAKTRFLLASHATSTRTIKDAQTLMEKAAERAGKIPRIVYTDKLKSYLEGIELAFGADTEHRAGSPFEVGSANNYIERFHGTLKERTKVMRALKNKETLEKFMDGWLVHYNFFRPHMSLNDMTPAQAAGIQFPFRNWKDVVEQPIERTSRIPVTEIKITIDNKPKKALKRKPTIKAKRKVVKSKPILKRVRL
jgi:transposase-like protein